MLDPKDEQRKEMSNAKRFIVDLVEGDDLPDQKVTWANRDLTGFSAKMIFRKDTGEVIEITGVITDVGPPGIATFSWPVGALTRGDHQGEFQLTDGGGNKETFPKRAAVIYRVRKDFGD